MTMPTPRSWKREARLLLIVAELSKEEEGKAAVIDVFTVDFVLQHPSLLVSFASLGGHPLPVAAEPSAAEIETSEEVLLRWKRSVGDQVLAPMLGRLVSRGLVRQSGDNRVALRSHGIQVARQLERSLGQSEQARLGAVAKGVSENGHEAREWLRATLAKEST
jgi:hypothetical protein